MEEAAMDINYLAMSNEYDVRFSGKIFLVESISIAKSMHN
jgi:hypothetical protein